jgi:exosortase
LPSGRKKSEFPSSRVSAAIAPARHIEYALPYIEVTVGSAAQTDSLRRPRLPLVVSQRWQAAVLVLLLGWLYSSILFHLVKQWAGDPNFSHGFFVPLFSLWVLWQNRSELAKLPSVPSAWGLLILFLGLNVLILGVLGAELFLSRISLLIVIAGLVIFFKGWHYFRMILFPWAFLVLMVPIPAIVFSQITFPLQLLASRIAAATLEPLRVPVLREGNIIKLPAMVLDVAVACSGIRSLLSLTTLAIIYGYLMETRISIRIVLALASVPIAIFANSMRIVVTGLLVHYWNVDKGEGFFHTFSGFLIFVVSLGMLFALHQLLRMAWRRSELLY